MTKPKFPKCIVPKCPKRATKWDGGVCGVVCTKQGMKPGYIDYRCDEHDPGNNYFILPEDYEGAMGDLFCLREELQKMHARCFRAENPWARVKPMSLRALKHGQVYWARFVATKPKQEYPDLPAQTKGDWVLVKFRKGRIPIFSGLDFNVYDAADFDGFLPANLMPPRRTVEA